MKREDINSLLVYVLMIVTAVIVGLYVISPLFANFNVGSSTGTKIGWALLLVLAAIIFNVIVTELGHVVGAKISGYKIFSFNCLGLCLYRKDNKWKFKFANFDGLAGETKIAPKKENATPRWFCLMPIIFYLIEVIGLMIGFYIAKSLIPSSSGDVEQKLYLLSILCIIFITIGGMLNLYNIFPAKLDTMTDGYRLTLISKKENIVAINELMRIECAYAENKELDDIKVFTQINDFTSSINLFTVYKHLKTKNYNLAETILDQIIVNKDKLSRDTYCSVVAQKMFIILLTSDYNNAKAYYDAHVSQEERRYISNDISMPSIRAYLLISSILDISEHEARFAKSRVNKALKRTLSGRVEVEKELYQIALDKVDQVRPEWHIKETEVK